MKIRYNKYIDTVRNKIKENFYTTSKPDSVGLLLCKKILQYFTNIHLTFKQKIYIIKLRYLVIFYYINVYNVQQIMLVLNLLKGYFYIIL